MPVRTSYLVCATPRSGSSLLCEVLDSTNLAGHPQEYFWRAFEPDWSMQWQVTGYAAYLRAALRRTSTDNGVFGAKIMWAHMDYFVAKLRQLRRARSATVPELFSAMFPNLHYIWIRREDTIRQAISQWRAMQTGVWNETDGTPPPATQPVFDFDEIQRLGHEIESHNGAWRRFFRDHRITPSSVLYEHLIADPEAVAAGIIRSLQIATPEQITFGKRTLRRQSDAISDEWVQRYRSIDSARGTDRRTQDRRLPDPAAD